MKRKIKQEARYRRHKRVRAKIFGTALRPRLCVFRSNKHIWAQLINDEKGKTLIAASDLELKEKRKKEKPSSTSASAKASAGKETTESKEEKRSEKVALAYELGKLIAKKALENKIEKVIFDRGSCKYHGRVKALAEGARTGGLKF
jgi:large subunit ribosomal protein L18